MPEEDLKSPVRPRHFRSDGLVLSFLVLAGIGFWFWMNHANKLAQANQTDPVRSVLHLETFVLNLADTDQRSYLRVGIDLELNQEAKHAEETVPVAQVRDTILGVLGEARVSDLLKPGGKTELKQRVLQALQDRVPALGVEEVYASAQVDQRKVGKLALAIQVAFQELGVFPASTTKIPLDINEPMPFSTVQVIENARRNTELGRVSSPPEGSLTAASEEANLTMLQTELQQALKQEIATHTVALHRETEGLVISLREFGFFDSGSAALRSSAMSALDRIASILALRTCRLRIEGHTDNIPIHTAQMASNWELSTARSTELVRLLILRYRFAPERLSAAGYAEYHPIASNDTAQGRAQNRRVDIVILTEHIASSNLLADARPSKPSAAIH